MKAPLVIHGSLLLRLPSWSSRPNASHLSQRLFSVTAQFLSQLEKMNWDCSNEPFNHVNRVQMRMRVLQEQLWEVISDNVHRLGVREGHRKSTRGPKCHFLSQLGKTCVFFTRSSLKLFHLSCDEGSWVLNCARVKGSYR